MATVKQVALLKEAPKVDILLIDAATTAIPGQQYRATDTDEIAYGKEDGTLRWLGTQDSETGFAVTDGTTSVNIGNDEIIEYTYGSLVKGILTETPEGTAAFAVGLDTDGATSGQVIKMVNIGTEEAPELVPQWAVDSASGFTEHSVPFAAADGTLVEDVVGLYYNNSANKFRVNIDPSEISGLSYLEDANFLLNHKTDNRETYFGVNGNGGSMILDYRSTASSSAASLTFRRTAVDNEGANKNFSSGSYVAGSAVYLTTGQDVGADKQEVGIFYSVIKDVQGDVADGSHKMRVDTEIWAHGIDDNSGSFGKVVINARGTGEVELPSYANADSNYLYTDADGVIQMGEQIIPNAIGTENQILQVINTGTVEAPVLSLEWVDAGSGFVADANNGLTVTDGIVQLGGALTQSTTVTTVGQSLSFENNDLAFTVADGVMQFRGAPGEFKMTDASLTFQDDRTDAAQVGIEYAADYSATFVDNSLVTKKFVTNLFDAVVYQNGITQADTGEVELGGALTKSTTIGLGTHGLNFTTAGGSIGSTADINISDTTKGLVLTAASGFQYRVGVAEDSDGNGFLTVSATGNSVQ